MDIWITAIFEEDEEELEPAYFEVEIIDFDDSVDESNTVTVEFTIENIGGTEGSQEIVFSVDGSQEYTEEIILGPGETYEGELTWDADDKGDHELEISTDDTSDSVTVTVEKKEEAAGIDMFMVSGIIIVIVIILAIIGYIIKGGSEEPRPTMNEEDKEFQPSSQKQQYQPTPPPSQETHNAEEQESSAKSDMAGRNRERKDRIRDELESLRRKKF